MSKYYIALSNQTNQLHVRHVYVFKNLWELFDFCGK